MKNSRIWTKEYLQDVVQKAANLTEALEMCGYKSPRANNFNTFKTKCNEQGVSYEHLRHQNRRTHEEYSDEEVFCKDSHIHTSVVKNHFLKLQEDSYQCSICGCREHNGKPIVLRLDHINEDKTDNRIENLRLICPNCDSILRRYFTHHADGTPVEKEQKSSTLFHQQLKNSDKIQKAKLLLLLKDNDYSFCASRKYFRYCRTSC